jgi:hypothetical protein
VGNGGSKARLQLIIVSLILRPLVTGRVVLRPFSTFFCIYLYSAFLGSLLLNTTGSSPVGSVSKKSNSSNDR